MRSITSTVLYKWFNKVWNDDNDKAIDELMTSDSNAHGILTDDQPKGAEGFRLFFKDFRSNFQGINIVIEDIVSQDDMEVARTTVSATHIKTGKRVIFTGMCMARVADGKIAEAWNNYDFLSMNQQLEQTNVPIEEC